MPNRTVLTSIPEKICRRRQFFRSLGFVPLPIHGVSKKPDVKWGRDETGVPRSERDIWGRLWYTPESMALRCGTTRILPDGQIGILTCLDADDKAHPGSSDMLRTILQTFGIQEGDTPQYSTPSGGRHWWVWLTNAPRSGAVKNFDPQHGVAGEIRHGSQGAALALVFGEGRELVAGNWNDLAAVDFHRLEPLTPNSKQGGDRPAVLRGGESTEGIADLDATGSPATLLRRALEIAREGKRNTLLFWLGCRLAERGMSFEDSVAYRDSYFKNVAAGSHSFTLAESVATWDSAYKNVGEHTRQITDAPTLEDRLFDSQALAGRSQGTDIAVLLAHCDVRIAASLEHGTAWDGTYFASCRDLALRAGVSAKTAAVSTNRLIDDGWLEITKRADGARAGEYRASAKLINFMGVQFYTQRVAYSSVCLSEEQNNTPISSTDTARADVFRYGGGLGKLAGVVFRLIERSASTLRSLLSLGHARNSIKRALERLKVAGLVYLDGSHWYIQGNIDWLEVAESLGLAGKTEADRAKHQKQRDEYRQKATAGKLGDYAKAAVERFLKSRRAGTVEVMKRLEWRRNSGTAAAAPAPT